nr:unnamed protein product [Callosobruchus analis]CAI5851591.1 unnamed protein product [Callosobruchus analis]
MIQVWNHYIGETLAITQLLLKMSENSLNITLITRELYLGKITLSIEYLSI